MIVGLEVHWRGKIESSPIESTYNGSGECMVLIMFFRVIHSLPPINNVTYVMFFKVHQYSIVFFLCDSISRIIAL